MAQQATIAARAVLEAEIRAIFENSPQGAAIESEIVAILRAREPLKKANAELKALCEYYQLGGANEGIDLAREPLEKAMAEIRARNKNNQRARDIFKNNQRGAAVEAEIEATLRACEALKKAISEIRALSGNNQRAEVNRGDTPVPTTAQRLVIFIIVGFIAALFCGANAE